MNILILGINYAPEMVGIGPYSAGMAQHLVQAGHEVTVICAKPYYPKWKVDPAYAMSGCLEAVEQGVRIVRVPTYVPAEPDGKRRLAHHASFAGRALIAARQEVRRTKPQVVIAVAPSLISVIAARHVAKSTGAKLWLHIQDFEVEAAFATNLLTDGGMLAKAAYAFEKWAIAADRVSTISPQMCAKAIEKGISAERVYEFRNWANIDQVFPINAPSKFRMEWNIQRPNVALYSGNIANKQGIDIILRAARLLRDRPDLMFVVCGTGPYLNNLIAQSADLDNIRFHDLQPPERLSELLGLATVHLLPQIANAADLVLPSKLTNMLASGRPVVATALPGTGLAAEVQGCGIITPPGDARLFAEAIEKLVDDKGLNHEASRNARERAVSQWSRMAILGKFEEELMKLASAEPQANYGRKD